MAYFGGSFKKRDFKKGERGGGSHGAFSHITTYSFSLNLYVILSSFFTDCGVKIKPQMERHQLWVYGYSSTVLLSRWQFWLLLYEVVDRFWVNYTPPGTIPTDNSSNPFLSLTMCSRKLILLAVNFTGWEFSGEVFLRSLHWGGCIEGWLSTERVVRQRVNHAFWVPSVSYKYICVRDHMSNKVSTTGQWVTGWGDIIMMGARLPAVESFVQGMKTYLNRRMVKGMALCDTNNLTEWINVLRCHRI